MKVREPVARPLDVVVVELLLSASQAFLVGVLMYLAVGIWDDRGVGTGPVAVILALLGLAVGAAWLYWLLGGTGWPLAAVDVPAAIFLGFALVLSWRGAELLRVDGLPTLVATAAAVFGVVCGAFLESPRRWRWDQRQRPRPGTRVPRVSPTTKAVAARIPRSLPRRADAQPQAPRWPSAAESPQPSEVHTVRIDLDSWTTQGNGRPSTAEGEVARTAGSERDVGVAVPQQGDRVPQDGGLLVGRPAAAATVRTGDPAPAAGQATPPSATGSTRRSSMLGSTRRPPAASSEPDTDPGSIELPTSVEPRAQRSPWAWAAPPEWNRDEDEGPAGGAMSGRP